MAPDAASGYKTHLALTISRVVKSVSFSMMMRVAHFYARGYLPLHMFANRRFHG